MEDFKIETLTFQMKKERNTELYLDLKKKPKHNSKCFVSKLSLV